VQKYPGKGDDPNGNPEEWDNTYVLIPSKHLPLLQPIRDLAAVTRTSAIVEPLMLLIEPTLKVLIDTGYDRTIPMGQNTPARLIPRINLVTLTADLGKAVDQGIRDALGIGSAAPTTPTDSSPDADTTTLRARQPVSEKSSAEPAKVNAEDETTEPVKDSSGTQTPADDEDEASGGADDANSADREISDPVDGADGPVTAPEAPTSESADAADAGDSASDTTATVKKDKKVRSGDRAARKSEDKNSDGSKSDDSAAA
jgi:hypothetical protein